MTPYTRYIPIDEKTETMRTITINVPSRYLEVIKKLVTVQNDKTKRGAYTSRSEVFRVAIHDFLKSEIEFAKEIEVIETETEAQKLRRLVYG